LDEIQCYPESNDAIKAMKEQDIKESRVAKIQWREYKDDGVVEGLEFFWNKERKSQKYG